MMIKIMIRMMIILIFIMIMILLKIMGCQVLLYIQADEVKNRKKQRKVETEVLNTKANNNNNNFIIK